MLNQIAVAHGFKVQGRAGLEVNLPEGLDLLFNHSEYASTAAFKICGLTFNNGGYGSWVRNKANYRGLQILVFREKGDPKVRFAFSPSTGVKNRRVAVECNPETYEFAQAVNKMKHEIDRLVDALGCSQEEVGDKVKELAGNRTHYSVDYLLKKINDAKLDLKNIYVAVNNDASHSVSFQVPSNICDLVKELIMRRLREIEKEYKYVP